MRRSIVPLCLLLILSGCVQKRVRSMDAVSTLEGTPLLRIRILDGQSQLVIQATQPPMVFTESDPRPRPLKIDAVSQYELKLSAAGWSLGGSLLGTGELTLQPAAPGTVTLNTKLRHRGQYRMIPVTATTFDVVNDVDIESYLQAVVTREMLAKWKPEALRAQAIIARTYAIYEARTGTIDDEYDLYADTRSQVYGGINSETPQAIDAVKSTTGIVVAYGSTGEERIFKAYFSACCGGVTQAASEVFGGPYIPPLSGRVNGSVCSIAPKFGWQTKPLEKAELTKRLRAWGAAEKRPEQNMGDLDRIDIQTLSPFGRPTRFLMTDSRGNRFSLKAEDLRHAMNFQQKPPVLFSSYVTMTTTPKTIQFNGHGHGHGVGMCQWCCQAMALQGYSHEAIVFASYPQSKLIRAY